MIATILKLLVIMVWTVIIAILSTASVIFDRSGNTYHRLSRLYMRGILVVSGVTVAVEGLEKLDLSRSHIYVSNHASYFDIPAIIGTIPDQIRIVYKKELEKIPFMGWALKYGKTYIAIDRAKGQEAVQSLEDAATKIRNGASVLLFGEGTRSDDGQLQAFKRGPFNLAMRAGVPVIPVAIIGSHAVLSKGTWRLKPGAIRLILGEPIIPPQMNGKDAELALRDQVREAIKQQLESALS